MAAFEINDLEAVKKELADPDFAKKLATYNISEMKKQALLKKAAVDELNQIINRSRHSAEICRFNLRQAKAQTENIKQTFGFVASFLAMTVAILLFFR